jgi:hypothetical protein
VPEKTVGTLTSNILNSIHTLISLIFSYRLYSVTTPGYSESFFIRNHGCIIALTPNLQKVSFYRITDFLHYSFTTELIFSLIFIKESYLSSNALLRYRESSLALWLLWRVNSGKVATRISTSADNFGLVQNSPHKSRNICAVISFVKP